MSGAEGRVVAVVVTFERAALLAGCLRALRAQQRPPDLVVAVDNASTDGTAALLRGAFPEVRVIRLSENVGSAGGFARGMAAALAEGADWVWLMDDDVVPDHSCLADLLAVAAASDCRVVVPRRLAPDGRDCANEAVLVEAAQRFEVVVADADREPYRRIDLFTFEGPLVHRAVIEAVGLPDPGAFIRGEDILYAVRINRRLGPRSGALAARALMRRQLPAPTGVPVRSRVKGWLSGDPAFELLHDEDHWKLAYELRNRHLVWGALGWRRRRLQLLVLHLGYVVVDLRHALRHGWDWRLRLRYNLVSLWLGFLGRATPFLHPRAWHAHLRAGRRDGAAPA